MAFDWMNYQTTGGNTGVNGGANINLDPSQLLNRSLMGPTAPNAPGATGVQIDPATGQTVSSAAPAAPGQPSAAPAGGGSVTMQQFNDAWMSSPYPGTVDGLKQFYAAHPEYAAAGITLGGSKGDKVYGPGNQYWGDAVISAALGGRGKSGLSGDPGGVAAGAPGSTLGSLGYGYGSAMAPFVPPSAQDAINSPGLQFALGEANRMGQNSAAAKGTLLNGRFQQALNASNIGNALQGYQGVFDRSYQTQTRNQDAPFDKNYRLAELGKPA